MNTKERAIYVIVSRTDTNMGRLIRKATRYDFNHVSISFDPSLEPMYSFARVHINEAFAGGFIEESLNRYCMGNKKSLLRVYKISVSNEKYSRVYNEVKNMYENKEQYVYDLLGAVIGHRRIIERDSYRKYTCLSFATKMLSYLLPEIDTKSIKSIREVCNILDKYFIKEIHISDEIYGWGNDMYYIKKGKVNVIIDTAKCLLRQIIW